MIELHAGNAADYLRDLGKLDDAAAEVVELADGVSNIVLRVQSANQLFILKQSRPQLRTQDAWFSDVERIWRERDVMRMLQSVLPTGVVPEVFFSDEPNYVVAMSHAPEPFRNWRTMLLAGEVDLSLGDRAGSLLARIHSASAKDPSLVEPFADRTIFEQLRVEPFYDRLRRRRPEVARWIDPLIERLRTVRSALCHGDFSPKNLLVHSAGFTLVDYETAHWGDAAMDLGFFVSHLLLKASHRWNDRCIFLDLVQSFWDGYVREIGDCMPGDLIPAGLAHLGACLMARVDGASPAPYLQNAEARDRVRRWGRTILESRPTEWTQVFHLTRSN